MEQHQGLAKLVLDFANPLLHMLGWCFIAAFIFAVAQWHSNSKPQVVKPPAWLKILPYPAGIDGPPPPCPDLAIPEAKSGD